MLFVPYFVKDLLNYTKILRCCILDMLLIHP